MPPSLPHRWRGPSAFLSFLLQNTPALPNLLGIGFVSGQFWGKEVHGSVPRPDYRLRVGVVPAFALRAWIASSVCHVAFQPAC